MSKIGSHLICSECGKEMTEYYNVLIVREGEEVNSCKDCVRLHNDSDEPLEL